MRRLIAPSLIGLGVFLVVAALLLRFFAYPTLAVAPVDQDSVTELTAQDATLFDSDPAVLENFTTDLTVLSKTVGDVEATQAAPDGVRCWVNTTSIRSDDGVVRSRSVESAGFDAVSGARAEGCEEWESTEEGVETPVTREGQIYKFPFDTQQEDYLFWDGDLKAATPAVYQDQGTVEGLKVYQFVQEIPETVVATREVPASILQPTPDAEGGVVADVVYSNTRTFYVEPVTGAVINRIDDQKTELVYGSSSLVVTEAELQYSEDQVTANVDEYTTKATLLAGIKGAWSLIAGLLGLLALGVGIAMGLGLLRLPGRRDEAPVHQERQLTDA